MPPLKLPDGLTLYFARHGQTRANLEKRFSGEKDTPLTALGREQAHEIGSAPRSVDALVNVGRRRDDSSSLTKPTALRWP